MANVLVIGSGGREHALAWKLAQSPNVQMVYSAPGNPGSAQVGERVEIEVDDHQGLLDFAQMKSIDLVVIGPDDALAEGLADVFSNAGIAVFGPSEDAAEIEASKEFSKTLMNEAGIPTPFSKIFTDEESAWDYIDDNPVPIVVKASGLALGKGVFVCTTKAQAKKAIRDLMSGNRLGDAGSTILIEQFVMGQEVSLHALSDGHTSLMLPPSQDHKAIGDGDVGPNTGGMGAYAPVPWVTQTDMEQLQSTMVTPALDTLSAEGAAFQGCLYPGLMITDAGPMVLEYNARFGDPETQVYMRLLKSDLYPLLLACATGKLEKSEAKVEWRNEFAVCVVLASDGYPGQYQKGFVISALEEAAALDSVEVFQAGTEMVDDQLVTDGGRVLSITATGLTIEAARAAAYQAADIIEFEGKYYRSDIGVKPSFKINWN